MTLKNFQKRSQSLAMGPGDPSGRDLLNMLSPRVEGPPPLLSPRAAEVARIYKSPSNKKQGNPHIMRQTH